MQIVVQVHSLNLPYFPFFHKFLAFFYIQTFLYTIMNLFITLLENVNKSRTSANNVSLRHDVACWREKKNCSNILSGQLQLGMLWARLFGRSNKHFTELVSPCFAPLCIFPRPFYKHCMHTRHIMGIQLLNV
jgi:hypothetical protein